MLRIDIPSNGPSGITFASFQSNDLPKPPNGVDEEINGDLVMIFDDEEQAVNYADALEDLSGNVGDNESPVKLAINDIIVAIQSDEFIQTYLG